MLVSAFILLVTVLMFIVMHRIICYVPYDYDFIITRYERDIIYKQIKELEVELMTAKPQTVYERHNLAKKVGTLERKRMRYYSMSHTLNKSNKE